MKSTLGDRLRPRQAAQEAGVSIGTIYIWMNAGYFKHWAFKRKGYNRGLRFIDRKSFEVFCQSQREEVTGSGA